MKRQWVFALPIGREITFWDEATSSYVLHTVDEDYGQRLVANTNAALKAWREDSPEGSTPYTLPVLREHRRMGWRGGSIFGSRMAGVGPRHGVYLDVEWTSEVEKAIADKATNFVSIGTLGVYTDYQGRDFSPMIEELSITENPRLKNMGAIQDTQSLRLSEAVRQGVDTVDEQKILEMLTQIADRLDAVDARVLANEEAFLAYMEKANKAEEGEPVVVASEDGEPKEEEKDPVLELSERLQKAAIKDARSKLAGLKLGELTVQAAPSRTLDRRAQGVALGLTGEKLARFIIGA